MPEEFGHGRRRVTLTALKRVVGLEYGINSQILLRLTMPYYYYHHHYDDDYDYDDDDDYYYGDYYYYYYY